MAVQESQEGTSAERRAQRSPLKSIACAVLILIPVGLALAVPLYQRTDPTLAGIPFFFWFQMLMAVAAASACGTTYLVLFRDESEEA